MYTGIALLAVLFNVARHLPVFTGWHQAEHTSFGEFFFIGGIAFSYVFFVEQPHTWFAALLTLSFADPFAALVGRKWGEHTYCIYGEKRSVEGTIACFVIATAIFMSTGSSVSASSIGGVVIALAEALSVRGSDNMTLPIIAGFVAKWLL